MTVSEWINSSKYVSSHRVIRIIDKDTNKGTGAHWIVYKDCICFKAKITERWIFLYI
jgi:hypothetical protein